MAKNKTLYVCVECGHETSGWLGKCPSCSAWNSFSARTEAAVATPGRAGSWLEPRERSGRPDLVDLSHVQAREEVKQKTSIAELDRVLGGGMVSGSLILLGGDPGIGKSTLALQILGHCGFDHVLYVSGEESASQIGLRYERLGLSQKRIPLLTTTRLSEIEEALTINQPSVAVIDSIQTVYADDLPSAPGSVTQVREAGMGFLRLAKTHGIAIILTGHVTKEGAIAGPRVLEHMVDTVLYFEGEKESPLRILRAVKNRFASTGEIGIFEMTEKGLLSVSQATGLFLDSEPKNVPGSVVSAVLEGTRPFLLEIQALTVHSSYGTPIRMAQGIDRSRLIMLMAVAEKKTKMDLSSLDAYVNVAGGMRVKGTSIDLAILAALLSSVREEPVSVDAVVLGEVGLTGEIRSVPRIADALEEAYRAGKNRFVVPASAKSKLRRFEKREDVRVYYVSELNEACDLLFSKEISL
ncbi:MAG TPA: DNA repair protein RadA [Bacillota bacterium]|jgi:DNA repair protein RadA/Sms|nr:DNA repair protein RadA [Fastidiosipila sp.]HPX93755.1 DNA repair protein RadA [Bacillota bacterium]HQB81574.1 DNA repair protein RadA [Bacillota bacterium]